MILLLEDKLLFKLSSILMITLALVLSSCASVQHGAREYSDPTIASQPHTILPGEQIAILVFGQAELSKTYNVDDKGNISMPLVGSISTLGLTPPKLANRITNLLAQKYLRNPSVSVEMVTYVPIYVTGAIKNAGQFAYTPGITAESAIVAAGGYMRGAIKTTVKITRRNNGRIFEANVALQTPLAAGDIIRIYGSVASGDSQ